MSKALEKICKAIFMVKREDIDYIRNTLESYDGMALVRTLDPYKALIEIYISPRCEEWIYELIYSLKRREGIFFVRYGA